MATDLTTRRADDSGRPTVLIVEDEPTTRESMGLFLKTYGYAAIEAETVERAVAALSNDISAVVLDVTLAGERSGLEVLHPLRLTPKLSDIPVLVLTGGFLTDAEEALIKEQRAHVFYKPESYDTILSALDRLTNRPAAAKTTAAPHDANGIAKLREDFLAQAQIESSLLASSLNADLDFAHARQILHRWVGVGGTLGFADISRRALALQPLLDEPQPAAVDRLRAGIEEIAGLMTAAARAPRAPKPLPTEVLYGLTGKTVALVGLATSETKWMVRALEQAWASSRVLNSGDSTPVPPGRELFDVVVIDAAFEWDAVGSGLPVLFLGATDAVARWTAAFHDGAHDFLVTPCEPEEFLLRVYRLATGARTPRAASGRAASNRQLRVVVADDDPTITTLVKAALQNYEFECHVARDGGQALELAETVRPDAFVLDLNMPQFDGFEVLAAIKQAPATADVPVVLLSARQQEIDILRGFSLGADDYVVKPFNPGELVARVKRLLRKRAP